MIVDEIIDNLISSLREDIIITKNEISDLEKEKEAYEKVLNKLLEWKKELE